MRSKPAPKPSYFNFLYGMIAAPSEQPAELAEKKHRKRSDFSSNQTASLALPDIIIKQKAKIISPAPVPDSGSSMITSIFNSLLSFVITPGPIHDNPVKKNTALIIEDEIHEKIRRLNQEYLESNDPCYRDNLILQQVKLLKTHIQEHAARRVDLFFYLLLAVHNKFVTVSKGDTVKQHGRGSKPLGTQACHSSLFPHVNFEAAPASWCAFWSAAPCVTLSGTQFEEALNMTVELPGIVNAFDGHIEGRFKPTRYTRACLDILNRAARNEIYPRQGMNEFLKVMNDFFLHFEKKYILSKSSTPNAAIKKVWEYEKKGTFSIANPDLLRMNDDYLYSMLRLTPAEAVKAKRSPQSLAPFYRRIQDEIFAGEPIKRRKMKKGT